MPKLRFLFNALFVLAMASNAAAQELDARLTVNASRISTEVDKSTFVTLQTSLNNFLTSRKWTKDRFDRYEKIKCNFLLTVEKGLGDNIYKGRLTVQASRPIFNSTYESSLLNYIDNDIVFKYIEFQPIEFNENRVQGNDPMTANLPAILAFYSNVILGLDYSSFQLKAGDQYFRRALDIVNSAPENKDIQGWRSFEGQRNRYWIADNFNNNQMTQIHDALYSYYRTGLDLFYENKDLGKLGILNSLNYLNNIYQQNPTTMVVPFFFLGRSNELVKIFSEATNDEKERAKDLLTILDLTHASDYKNLR